MTLGKKLKQLDDRWVPSTLDTDSWRRKTSLWWVVSLAAALQVVGGVLLAYDGGFNDAEAIAITAVVALAATCTATMGGLGWAEHRRMTHRASPLAKIQRGQTLPDPETPRSASGV